MPVLYEDAYEALGEALPDWWAVEDPESILSAILRALAGPADDLSLGLEKVFADQALDTATLEGLRSEYAYAYQIEFEQLAPTVDALREYLKAWIGADGSTESIVTVLTALLSNPNNLALISGANGQILTFSPPSGSGSIYPATDLYPDPALIPHFVDAALYFPADGSGLIMFQSFEQVSKFIFPANGTGLIFPAGAGAIIGQALVVDPVNLAAGPAPGPPGPGLRFPQNGWVEVLESASTYTWTVKVKNYLDFDRAAFARAVERLRQAHLLPATIIEVND